MHRMSRLRHTGSRRRRAVRDRAFRTAGAASPRPSARPERHAVDAALRHRLVPHFAQQVGGELGGRAARSVEAVDVPTRSDRMTKQSPPIPVMCGSTTQRTAEAAIAASTALPPVRRMSMAVGRRQRMRGRRHAVLGDDGRPSGLLEAARHGRSDPAPIGPTTLLLQVMHSLTSRTTPSFRNDPDRTMRERAGHKSKGPARGRSQHVLPAMKASAFLHFEHLTAAIHAVFSRCGAGGASRRSSCPRHRSGP